MICLGSSDFCFNWSPTVELQWLRVSRMGWMARLDPSVFVDTYDTWHGYSANVQSKWFVQKGKIHIIVILWPYLIVLIIIIMNLNYIIVVVYYRDWLITSRRWMNVNRWKRIMANVLDFVLNTGYLFNVTDHLCIRIWLFSVIIRLLCVPMIIVII